VAFIAWERHASEPMLPLRFFGSRDFALGNAASVFLYAALYGALFFFAQFLQNGLGYGPLDAGLRLLPWTATLFVVAPLAGASVSRFGERPLVVGGLALQALGMGWIGLIAAPDLPYVNLVAPLIVAGAGVSMAMPAAQSAVLGAVARTELGKASGTFNMLRFLGGTFGIAITVVVFTRSGGYGSAQAFTAGFSPAIGIAAVLSLLGAVAGLGLAGQRAIAVVPAPA
jgi:MFS family permease